MEASESGQTPDIERLLAEVNAGGSTSVEQLTDAVYQQLREMAKRHLRGRFGRGAGGLTWQPTVLVNETLLRIIKQRQRYDNQGHFFAIATTVMKRVLLDYIRMRGAQKRGGKRLTIEYDPDLHDPAVQPHNEIVDIEAFFNALEELSRYDARKADVVRMRVLWGITVEEIAVALGVGRATIERDWSFAKAWLKRELDERSTE